MNLLKAQVFHIYEALEVVIVCKHNNFMLAALKVVFSSLDQFNNNQKLTIVGIVLCFCKNHLLREKNYSILLA